MSCKDCPNRTSEPNCHINCEKYAAFKAEREKINKKRREYYDSKRRGAYKGKRNSNAIYKSPKR